MAAIITEFQFDQFQGRTPLRVLDLGNGLNVALARSDAGRDQLLNVIPFTIYGKYIFSRPRGGTPPDTTSAVLMRTDDGVFTVQRDWSNGDLRIIASDGTAFGASKLRDLVDGIGFRKYRSIFTFRIARLAHFATGEANDSLVEMADYLRRKSPVPPMPLAPRNYSIPELGHIYSGLGDLSAVIRRQADQADNGQPQREPKDRSVLSRELKKVEASLADTRAKYQHVENELDETRAALSLNRASQHLASIDHQLAKQEKRSNKTGSDVGLRNSLDRLVGRIDDCKHQLLQLKEEHQDIRRQNKELADSRIGTQAVAQIEAMLLHEKSLVKEEEAVEQLKLQVQDAEAELADERHRANTTSSSGSTRLSDSQALARIDALAERLRDAERDQEVAEQRYAQAEVGTPETRITPRSPGPVHPEDAVAIHEAEQQVIRLRERLGLDDQAARLEAERAELLAQVRRLYRDQLLPFPMVLAMGVPFMLGVALVIYGLFMHQTTDWQKVLFGLAIALATALIKMSLDRGSSELLAKTRARLARVHHQFEQFAGARGDAETTGALQQELEIAEDRWAELQAKFAPADAAPLAYQEISDVPSLETARLQLNNAHQRIRDLRGDWQDLLTQLGLPTTLTPGHAREAIADQVMQLARNQPAGKENQLEHQIQHLRPELDRRKDWLNVLGSQARQLVKDLGFSNGSGTMPEQFDALRDALRDARELASSKKQLVRDLKRIRQKRSQLKESGRRLVEQHRRLAAEAKLKQQQAKINGQLGHERAKLLQEQRERLEREVDEIHKQHRLESRTALTEVDDEELEQRLQGHTEQLEKLREKLLKQSEQRGRIRAQLSSDAPRQIDDSRAVFEALHHRTEQLAAELKETAKQVEQAAAAEAAAARSHCQYEYLQRAGRYLADLSDGDFGRIEMLETDPGLGLVNQRGQLVPLDHVDRHHYANLYFSLWLARLECFVDRGYHLPAILEDPLAATKRSRKPVVAEMLRDFGMRGLQFILITSKESSADIFGRLGTPIADLSDRQIVLEAESSESPYDRSETEQSPATTEAYQPRRSFSPLG